MSLFVRDQPARRTTPNGQRRDFSGPWGPAFDGRTVPTPGQDYMYGGIGRLRVGAVVACVGLRAGAYAQLPFRGYSDDAAGNAVRLSPQPSIVASPSDVVVPAVHKIQMSISRDIWGFAIGRITAFDGAMYPTRAEWICPDDTSHKTVAGGQLDWRINGQPVDSSLLLHVPSRWVTPGNPAGISPLEYSGLDELARKAQQFGRDWFVNGAGPSAIIYSDEKLDDDQQQSLLDKITMRWRSRKPAILGSGLKYERVSVAANESQFLETATKVASDIAVSFNLPPSKIGAAISGSALTYQNLEQDQQRYLIDCINPDLVVISESFDRHLRPGQYTKWTTAAFTQSDTLTQYKAGEIGVRSRIVLPDEVRSWFHMPPLPNGMGQVFPSTSSAGAGDVNSNPDGMAAGGTP